ncbi:MAG: carbohydrate ABC transporter permease [Bullifex sp.]
MKHVRKILLVLLAFSVLFPFLYAFSASFFSAADFTTYPAKFFPSSIRFTNYEKVFRHRYFLTYVMNSAFTGTLGTLLRMTIAYLAAFAFSHYRFKGSGFIFSFLVLTMFIPSDLLLAQNYITIQGMGLLDTYLGIISTSLLGAGQIFMLRQFMKSIPAEMHESAVLDGAGDFTYMRHILIPVSKAVIVALSLQCFVGIFNAYLWPLLVTNTPRMRTVQVGITTLGFSESLNYGPTMAAIMILFIPFAILLMVFRKTIMKALEKGYLYT